MNAVGTIEESIPMPTAAPQTGAPNPHACRAVSPKTVARIPIIELLYVLARSIFSFVFLTIQVMLDEKESMNIIAITVYTP